MKCVMCETKLRSLDDTRELWFNGHRIWICKSPVCHLNFVDNTKDPNVNMNDLIYKN